VFAHRIRLGQEITCAGLARINRSVIITQQDSFSIVTCESIKINDLRTDGEDVCSSKLWCVTIKRNKKWSENEIGGLYGRGNFLCGGHSNGFLCCNMDSDVKEQRLTQQMLIKNISAAQLYLKINAFL